MLALAFSTEHSGCRAAGGFRKGQSDVGRTGHYAVQSGYTSVA